MTTGNGFRNAAQNGSKIDPHPFFGGRYVYGGRNEKGQYQQVGLAIGNYHFTASKEGYVDAALDIKIGMGLATQIPELQLISQAAAKLLTSVASSGNTLARTLCNRLVARVVSLICPCSRLAISRNA